MATVIQTSTVSRFNGTSASPGASITLTGVAAGNALIAVVCASRYGTSSGYHVAAITSSPSSTFSTAGASFRTHGDTFRTTVEPFIAHAVTGGSTTVTLDLTYEDETRVSWFVVEVNSLASSASFDKTDDATVDDSATTITAGPTATLSQASEFILAVAASRYWSTYNGGAVAPSGYTTIASNLSTDSVGTTFLAAYKNVAATTAVDATWAVPATDGGAAVVSTFRNNALVVRCTFLNGTPPDDIDGITGITAHVWAGDPSAGASTKYTGLSAEASGNTLFIPAPGWATAAQTVTVIAYSASGGASPLMLGTVE